MKIRRRFASGFQLGDLFGWVKKLRPGKGRNARWLDSLDRADGTPSNPATVAAGFPNTPTVGIGVTRNTGFLARTKWLLGSGWLYPILFAACLVAGYLWAALVFFPAPFFASDQSVPALVGMNRRAAEDALSAAGFTLGELNVMTHPTAPNGQVIWQDPVPETVIPEGTRIELFVSGGQQPVPVPDIAEYEGVIARRLIEASGLIVARVESVQTAAPKGVAVNTRPTAGATLSPGTGITLVVSRGAPTVRVPDLAGMTVEEAQNSLEAVGLTLGTLGRRTSSAQPEGTVYLTSPPAGTLASPLTPVDLTLARRP